MKIHPTFINPSLLMMYQEFALPQVWARVVVEGREVRVVGQPRPHAVEEARLVPPRAAPEQVAREGARREMRLLN